MTDECHITSKQYQAVVDALAVNTVRLEAATEHLRTLLYESRDGGVIDNASIASFIERAIADINRTTADTPPQLTVLKLRDLIKDLPDDATVHAYEGEDTVVLINDDSVIVIKQNGEERLKVIRTNSPDA